MPSLALVGYTNAGKTTLFNALTGLAAPTASHPYTTKEPNVGMARVPDQLLERIAELERSAKVTPASLELLDLPAWSREQAGKHLARLRETDALIVVVRAFEDESVGGSDSDPLHQAEELLLELTLADHEVFARKRERLAKEADRGPGAEAIAEATEALAGGEALRQRQWSDLAHQAFRDLNPLTLKPTVWVVNVDESTSQTEKHEEALRRLVPPGDEIVVLSARLEAEAAEIPEAERPELMQELGLGEGALARMVRATYQSLELLSFYTVGPREARAWTLRRGALAPEAAGRIHSDLERGFIRAEVAPIEAVIEAGGWEAAKKSGVIRIEGKAYQVAPGDVLLVRFSV